eukprot:CAMPEP_0167795810 /NCGR_PEP_ID=MMETSP0111_2-20121227/14665_1 /TAXON_ID=91324 /ORGANISM="Lotharella globosa, Strain CCCM811" /LENGTH=169 /DNA_ID=CAMNT_0007689565 /DNA_START=662 /DNA_END=1171 /DNA_ORIENTATION=-
MPMNILPSSRLAASALSAAFFLSSEDDTDNLFLRANILSLRALREDVLWCPGFVPPSAPSSAALLPSVFAGRLATKRFPPLSLPPLLGDAAEAAAAATAAAAASPPGPTALAGAPAPSSFTTLLTPPLGEMTLTLTPLTCSFDVDRGVTGSDGNDRLGGGVGAGVPGPV